MSSLHVGNVKPATLEGLRRLARIHHRPMQGELHAIIDQAAQLAPPAEEVLPLDLVSVKTGRTVIMEQR